MFQETKFSYWSRNKLPVQQVNYEQDILEISLAGVLSIKISNSYTKEVVNFQLNKPIMGRHSRSLNKTVRDTKIFQENATNKEVMECNSSKSNFTQTSHRSNQQNKINKSNNIYKHTQKE